MEKTKIAELNLIKQKLGLTYKEISDKSGIPLSTVQKVLGGTTNMPRSTTIEAIEKALTDETTELSQSNQISIGNQDFASIIENNYFYVDKTVFISEWWNKGDVVTLITRPRRFGKSLNLSMVNYFFSNKYPDGKKWFKDLAIWGDDRFQKLQGAFPVIFLSFASVKEANYLGAVKSICDSISELYKQYREIANNEKILESDREYFNKIMEHCPENEAANSINRLCRLLYESYGQKVIVLLDEYDTPMQEAYLNGYWSELTVFIRSLFNSTFKTNRYLLRGLLSGITRISKESIFSDLNNIRVITTTSEEYADKFGFTEDEVESALDTYGIDNKDEVKRWYDGFRFGSVEEIYNPWSILFFLKEKRIATYWANTSSNELVSKLIREGDKSIKNDFEQLLTDVEIETELDEEIVYNNLKETNSGIWSLLLASGYLKTTKIIKDDDGLFYGKYRLKLTNLEVKSMFQKMVSNWFRASESNYNEFIKALLNKDTRAMNYYMNQIALSTFSFFDTGKNASDLAPERFYHGFVLGLLVDLRQSYVVKSNRESGFGRYDVILEPRDRTMDAFILEFKVHDPYAEKTLEDTVMEAKKQIEDKKYSMELENAGIAKENIFSYGFAFEGKKVLIG